MNDSDYIAVAALVVSVVSTGAMLLSNFPLSALRLSKLSNSLRAFTWDWHSASSR